MSHKMLISCIVKVSVLGYFPLLGCIIQINVRYNNTTNTINSRNIIFIKNNIICRS